MRTTKLPLAKRVRSGLSWNLSSSLIAELIRFVRSVLLARLLLPEDFGLLGMALTVVSALNALSSLGLTRTIVANRFDTQDELHTHLNTVWSVELVRSFAIALLMTASAVPMARFYGQAHLKTIIPILGLTTLIQGFQNVGLVILRKEITFARIFWYELATNVAGIMVTVALVLVWRNVWALVIGLLLTAVLGTVFSYVFHPYRPRPAFEKQALRRVISVGKLAFVIAVASYVTNMADNVMVGRLLGSAALGNYSLAFNIASAPISVLVFSVGAVLSPAYAEITASRPRDLELAIIKVFSIALLIMITIAVPLFLLADDVVQLLFGSKWTTAGAALRILALVIPLRGLSLIMSSIFWGLNRPKDIALGSALEAIVFLAALFPLIKAFGLTGAAWASLIAFGFACINRSLALNQIIPGILAKLTRISISALAAGGAGLLIGAVSLNFLASPVPRVIVAGLLSTIVTAAIFLFLKADLRRWLREWY